jgi:hypothetical protein
MQASLKIKAVKCKILNWLIFKRIPENRTETKAHFLLVKIIKSTAE